MFSWKVNIVLRRPNSKTNYAAESTRRIKGDQRKCFVITRSKY